MSRIFSLAILVIGTLFSWAASAEPISLHGSTTVMNMLVLPNKAEIEAASGQQLEIVGNGSQRGLADLLSGKAQIAMISASLELEVNKVNEKSADLISPGRLNAHAVGEARVAFAVHPSNSVKSLSGAQLADVLSGKVQNWREVGGPDLPIMVVTAQPGDGLRTMVEGRLLNGDSVSKDARAMTNATQIAKVVAQVPGAIGIVAAASIDASVVRLATDVEIVQPLILVTLGPETQEVRRVIDAVAKFGKFPKQSRNDG
ncbi:MAG: substrate-binding domain-containing protein [Methylobacteriaceae bacterium]|nr:substrate-binding domain-containing protein [Methylobacteriaceae bacterium]